jgi:4a-hydroxytetrahydrobiopterin dehydratase
VNRAELLLRRCRPQEGKTAFDRSEAERWLAAIPDWKLNDAASAIERTFRFKDYYQTMAFVNALAFIVHGEDHHPDLEVGYNRCAVRFSTHSVKGLSENDFICAAKIDALPAS